MPPTTNPAGLLAGRWKQADRPRGSQLVIWNVERGGFKAFIACARPEWKNFSPGWYAHAKRFDGDWEKNPHVDGLATRAEAETWCEERATEYLDQLKAFIASESAVWDLRAEAEACGWVVGEAEGHDVG